LLKSSKSTSRIYGIEVWLNERLHRIYKFADKNTRNPIELFRSLFGPLFRVSLVSACVVGLYVGAHDPVVDRVFPDPPCIVTAEVTLNPANLDGRPQPQCFDQGTTASFLFVLMITAGGAVLRRGHLFGESVGKVFYGIMVFGFALIFIFYWKAWAYAFLELLELTLVLLFSALSMTVLVCLAFYMLFFIFSSITGVAGADPPGIDTLAYYVLVVTLFLQLVMAGWVAFR
jgi:hypothetical protein